MSNEQKFSHRQRQLLHVHHARELLHAGQDGLDPALGGEGDPPLVLEHKEVGQSERADDHVFGGGAEQLHQKLQHFVPMRETCRHLLLPAKHHHNQRPPAQQIKVLW